MRQILRDLLESFPPQANSPQPRQQAGKGLWVLRQALRVHAGVVDARAHAQAFARVRRLRQEVQSPVAASGSHSLAHRRAAIQVSPVRQVVR